LVQKCGEAGIQVSPRSVSRCLKGLTEKALLQRDGKGYMPTEIGTKRVANEINAPKLNSAV
jgi:Mn-dependent DtxR family transcriptional regulator